MSGEYGFSVSGLKMYDLPDVKPAMNSVAAAFDAVAADVGSLAAIKHVHYLGPWATGAAVLPRSQVAFVAPVNCVITGINFLNADTLTAHDDNFIELEVINKEAGGVTSRVGMMQSKLAGTSGTGHWAAYAKKSLGILQCQTLLAGRALTVGGLEGGTQPDVDLIVEITAVRTDLYAV